MHWFDYNGWLVRLSFLCDIGLIMSWPSIIDNMCRWKCQCSFIRCILTNHRKCRFGLINRMIPNTFGWQEAFGIRANDPYPNHFAADLVFPVRLPTAWFNSDVALRSSSQKSRPILNRGWSTFFVQNTATGCTISARSNRNQINFTWQHIQTGWHSRNLQILCPYQNSIMSLFYSFHRAKCRVFTSFCPD